MWADPIYAAFDAAQGAIEQWRGRDGLTRAEADDIAYALGSIVTAKRAREFEKLNGRLITAEDRLA